jgi:hypothetical protein
MADNRTNTSIYMYAFYSNWSAQDREIIKTAKFDNLYVGDVGYKHYNYLIDMEAFLKDNYIFGLLSESENLHYEDIVQLLPECKETITSYDCTDYLFNSGQDEIVTDGSRKTMFVFNVTGKHQKALYEFKQSRFSYMYDADSKKALFNTHTDYLVKLMKGKGHIKVDSKNVDDIFADLSLEKELDNIKVSYYHILNKSPELRTVIERIYNINLPKESELKSRLDWNKEIYNYTKVMNQELIMS